MSPFRSVKDEMDKFEAGTLHSGSNTGKVVTNPKQAIAIALSEKRKAMGTPGLGHTRHHLTMTRKATLPKGHK
jgi:hypothetical protein